MFSNLWQDDFLQVTSKVRWQALRTIRVEPYTWALLKHGLKARAELRNVERNKTLDRVMEYVGTIGVEIADMLASVNLRVEELAPHMPVQHTFGGNGLHQFIGDHQDHLEQLEDQLSDLIMMTEQLVIELHLTVEAYHWDLCWVERLNGELLIRVMVLEGHQGNLIKIPDIPPLILIPALGGNLLVEIVNRTDNDMVQVVVEDQVEAGVR